MCRWVLDHSTGQENVFLKHSNFLATRLEYEGKKNEIKPERYLIANYAFLLICACKITGNWVAIALIVVLAK